MPTPQPEIINPNEHTLIVLVKRDGTVSLRSERNTAEILRIIEGIREELIVLTTPPAPREKD